MKQKVAIITGAGQGIGRAMAGEFLKSGFAVAIADIDIAAGEETRQELALFKQASFIECDVSSEQQVKKMILKAVNYFSRIDVLVNNAGIFFSKPLVKMTLPEWEKILSVNLTGAFLCCKYAAGYLKKSKGAIINISSTRAIMSERDTEGYSASKGGLLALTHALSISLANRVRVNSISPGWIDTSLWKKKGKSHLPDLRRQDHIQHPVGRVGEPFDVAALAVFLASKQAGFITGANFIIDGGMTRKMIYL